MRRLPVTGLSGVVGAGTHMRTSRRIERGGARPAAEGGGAARLRTIGDR